MASDQFKGVTLAVSSSIFIGSSFIIKKKGLRLASAQGTRAGSGGYSYLLEPLWWSGLLTMIVGELANFAAYAFAPAILVTPLGALSIIVSAILAHLMLQERLNTFGVLGCMLCIVGSLVIVLHAPLERQVSSVIEIWTLAMRPGFLTYVAAALTATVLLIMLVAPVHGSSNVFVYIAICSIVGSLSVVSCKALGIALKLTYEGTDQLWHQETAYCVVIVAICVVTQMNYLNKALDLFNTAIVSPIYYVMFTTLTVAANVTLFQEPQTWKQILTESCGFVTIVVGTFLLHATRDMDTSMASLAEVTRARSHNSEPSSVLMQQLPLVSPQGLQNGARFQGGTLLGKGYQS